MIFPDTNVISETIRVGGNEGVKNWFDLHGKLALRLAAPVFAELLLGAALLPLGRRRQTLKRRILTIVDQVFDRQIVVFDRRAAEDYARIISQARAGGRAIALIDGQIAAIAAAHGATVATRDTAPFAAAGIPVINPWQPSS